LGQLLEHNPAPTPVLIELGLLPSSGILFVGGEPKVGKSLLVANLALALASGCSRAGFQVPQARRVLICQFELPTSQFAARLEPMRKPIGSAADSNLLVDTEAAGHLLSVPRGLDHFLHAVRAAKADVVVLDPLYSTHDQDENDTRAMAASGSARFNQLRQQIMTQSECSRRTAQLAIRRACQEGTIVHDNGQYRLPL